MTLCALVTENIDHTMSSSSTDKSVGETTSASLYKETNFTSDKLSGRSLYDYETKEDDDEEYDDGITIEPTRMNRSDSSLSLSFIDLSRLLLIPEFDFGFDQVNSTKKKLKNMRNRTKETFRRLKEERPSGFKATKFTQQELTKLLELMNKRLAKFDERVQNSLQSSETEKLFYAFAVSLIAVAGYTIGKYPTYFPLFHTVLFCLLMPIRFYTYFKIGFQYYLADLCYYVNLLLLLFLWVFPNSKSLFISVFSLTMGTLSFAVITWRNSLVLHSIEKTTSSIIHVMPPITMFVLVHQTPKDYIQERYPAIADVENWNFVNGIIWTSIYYTVWQVGYHYFITVRRKEQIAKGRMTSFTYLKEKNRKSFLGRIVNRQPYAWMQIAVFTLIQFGYQILTMIPCPIWFRYKHACATFVSFIFFWSAYNGATYYIEVFGKRFEKELKRLKAELAELQETVARQQGEKGTPLLSAASDSIPSGESFTELKLSDSSKEGSE